MPVFRAYHEPNCPEATEYDNQLWAADVLAHPDRAAIEASGISADELRRMR